MTDAFSRFQLDLRGISPNNQQKHWKGCVNFVDIGVSWLNDFVGPSGMAWITNRFFVDKTYSQELKNITVNLLKSIEEEFIQRVGQKRWISDEVKQKA